MVDTRVPGMRSPAAAQKQVAELDADPSAYFRRARAEAAQAANQQIETELALRAGSDSVPARVVADVTPTNVVVDLKNRGTSGLEAKNGRYTKAVPSLRTRIAQKQLKQQRMKARSSTLEHSKRSPVARPPRLHNAAPEKETTTILNWNLVGVAAGLASAIARVITGVRNHL